MADGGWGEDGWGVGPWGGDGEIPVIDAAAEALRENVVRATFTLPLLLTGLLDRRDGLNVAHYLVGNPSGQGLDDEAAKSVNVILVEPVAADPCSVDIYVDRPFTRYPCTYELRCVNMYDSGGELFADVVTKTFYGLASTFEKPVTDTFAAGGTRDFANPTAKEALFDPLPEITVANLGTFPYGDDGDYGYDEGTENLKKRIIRRCVVRPGGFVWLQKYGAGIGDEGKKLNNAARRERIKATLKDQILQEPEVRYVNIAIKFLPSTPGIIWFVIKVLTVTNKAFQLDVPFVGL